MIYNQFNIYNLTLVNADQEYSQALTLNPSFFELKCRTLADLKFSLTSGESGTNYITIPAGASWNSRGKIVGRTKTIYVQSPSAGAVVEICEWV